jgi:hypothetical protein
MSWLNNLTWQARACWKRFTSFFKQDWTSDDYPIRINFHAAPETVKSWRITPFPWSAFIWNWLGMMGGGNTRQEALGDLRRHFENFKGSGRKLPRPGTHVPIEFVSTSRIDMHPELKGDFIRRVLDLPWAFLSDESSLGDFHEGESNDFFVGKIRTVYGVHVSDIASGNLAEIFERIAKTKVT